jgi:hypothetical protein
LPFAPPTTTDIATTVTNHPEAHPGRVLLVTVVDALLLALALTSLSSLSVTVAVSVTIAVSVVAF